MDMEAFKLKDDIGVDSSTAASHVTSRSSHPASTPPNSAAEAEISRIKSSARAKMEGTFTKLWDKICETVLECQNDTPNIAQKEVELEQARRDIQKLEERIRQQEEEIIRYRSQTLRSIDSTEISDRQISDELTNIYMGLSNWVEGLPEPAHPGCDWEAVFHFMACEGYQLSFNELIAYKQAADAQEELVKHVVFSILWANIFVPLLVGASEEQNSWLGELCSNMELLQPEKDISGLGKWRSETFRACAKSQEYKQHLERRCIDSTYDLEKVLTEAGYCGDKTLRAKCQRFYAQIAKPVAEFATKLKCSPKVYRWAWEHHSGAVQKNVFQRLNLIDSKSHSQIMKDKFRGLDDDRVIGECLFTLFPTLYRVRGQNQPDIAICKGFIVVSISG